MVCCLWVVAFTILVGLSCGTHFSALWTSSKAVFLQYCGKRPHQFLLSMSISDFLLDFWIIALPIPQVCCDCNKRSAQTSLVLHGLMNTDSENKNQPLTSSCYHWSFSPSICVSSFLSGVRRRSVHVLLQSVSHFTDMI